MQFISRTSSKSLRWKTYCQLELIPLYCPTPLDYSPRFAFGLTQAWRILVIALLNELVEEQQREYLERCWQLDAFGKSQLEDRSSWRKLWTLMN